MIAAGSTPKQLARFEDCGSCCHLWHSPSTDRTAIIGNLCRSRWCSPCAVARSRLIQSNLCKFVAGRTCRMLTLTLLHSQKPLGRQITRINRCFAEMRADPEFTDHVTGWISFLEVKWIAKTQSWHVHLHLICEGSYWDQKRISSLWKACTGDSYIVDIQRKGTPASMAYYGAKYASKPIDAASMGDTAQHADAIFHIGRRRLWQIGGTWKGHLKLLAKGTDPKDWQYVGSANALWADGAEGRTEALALIEEITAARPHTPDAPPPDSS